MKLISKFATALLLLALMLSIMPAATQSAQAATCNWAQFIADVTVPDGTNYAPGTTFKKTWRLKNIGTCAWGSTDVSLIFDSGERMGAPASNADLSRSMKNWAATSYPSCVASPKANAWWFPAQTLRARCRGRIRPGAGRVRA